MKLPLLFKRILAAIPTPCTHVEVVRDDNGRVFEATNLTESFGPLAVGDWNPPEPHPVPRFAATVKIQRQPIASINHCKKCGAWFVANGFNQRDCNSAGDVIPFPK